MRTHSNLFAAPALFLLTTTAFAPGNPPAASQIATTGMAKTDTVVVDSFESVSQWTTNPAQGVEISVHPDSGLHGRAMRVDFDFHGHTGYWIVHRNVNFDLPANYEFKFAVRGAAPTNNLEFKLVDETGANVWWSRKANSDYDRGSTSAW